WRDAFLKFTETGQASPEFLQYLEGDANAQKAVELAFEQQAQAFEDVAKDLAKPAARAAEMTAVPAPEGSGKNLQAGESALRLPEGERDRMIQATVAALTSSAQPKERHALRELADSLGSSLDKMI